MIRRISDASQFILCRIAGAITNFNCICINREAQNPYVTGILPYIIFYVQDANSAINFTSVWVLVSQIFRWELDRIPLIKRAIIDHGSEQHDRSVGVSLNHMLAPKLGQRRWDENGKYKFYHMVFSLRNMITSEPGCCRDDQYQPEDDNPNM